MEFNLNSAEWIFKPETSKIEDGCLEIKTEPGTDFWQRTYYGFRNDNSPGLLIELNESFTFTVKTAFNYSSMFDQCGLLVYIDSSNWMKAGLEYENEVFSRLGSVVTNMGYSDWATTDVGSCSSFYYRLNRLGPDFLIESSEDGVEYSQMRIFHMHALGETADKVETESVISGEAAPVRFGLYACSPGKSSFTARFSEIKLEKCKWKAH